MSSRKYLHSLEVGDILRSLDPRDDGRTVRVIEILEDGRVRVQRGPNGRRTALGPSLGRWMVIRSA